MARIGIDVAGLERGQVADAVWHDIGISVTRHIHPQWDGYEIWLAPENTDDLWDALTSAGAVPVGSDALEMYRIARGVPRYSIDLRERDLPQETGQEHALNFTKGCYIGQEIVERIRSRGNVHRALIGLEVEGEPPQPGTKIRAADKDSRRNHQRSSRTVCRRRADLGARLFAARVCESRHNGASRRAERDSSRTSIFLIHHGGTENTEDWK